MDPEIPWSDKARQALGLPSSVYSRAEAVKYLLCSAVDRDPGRSENLYFVGRYYLLEDCEQAVHYLELYRDAVERPRPESADLLARIESSGCDAAASWLKDR